MSSDPNYRPNTPHQSTTQHSNFSSNVGTSAFNVPPTTNIRPPNLNTRPPLPMPPFPPSQLQQLLHQPSSFNQHNGQQTPRPPPPHFPPTHIPPPRLHSPRLPPTHLPPPQHPPPSHPPPNHSRPQLTQPHCPPPHLPPPPPQPQSLPARFQTPSPSASLQSLLSGFIPSWHQIPQDAILAAIHKSPPEQQQQQQQQQISTFYDIKSEQKLHEFDQTIASGNSSSQYNKLSTEDRNWIKDFEVVVNHKSRVPLMEKPLKENKKIKLSEVTLLASESQILLKTLAELKAEMEQNASTATAENWQRLVAQVEQTKEKFNSNIVQLQNPQIMKVVQNRRYKRKRLKANKKKFQEENYNKICEWKQKEVEIDTWRERIIKREKDELKEKQIKAEADSVLSEIRLKENEASRMIQLLDALKQLRRTRTNKGDKFGYVTNSISDNRFDTVLSKLQGLVSSHLSDYKLEEATLRVMMEESGSKRSEHLSGRQDKDTAVEVKIDNLLFGQNSHKKHTGSFDLQSLIERRNEWDEFLASEGNPLGSAVPLGWVVPPTNPSQYWAKFFAS